MISVEFYPVKRRLLTVGLLLSVASAWGQSVSQVTVSPASILGGSGSKGTIILSSAAPTGGLVVKLGSTSSVATVPASATVAATKTTATFAIKTIPVAKAVVATISASTAAGKQTTTLTVNPPALKSFTVSPASVIGGTSVTATISLTGPAPTGGLKVQVTSSTTSAKISSSVVIPAGATSVTSPVSTTPVPVKTSARLTAGNSVAATLTIASPDLKSFTLSPATVMSGNPVTGTLVLTGNAPTGGFSVAVKSSAAFIRVPTPVVVPAGTATVTFPVTALWVSPTATGTIIATGGAKSLSAPLTVSPGNPLSAGPWPKAHADMQNTGRSKAPRAKGKLKWTADFYAGWYSQPVLSGNQIAVTTRVSNNDEFAPELLPSRLLMFDLTGKLTHAVSLNGFISTTPIAGPNGLFYVATEANFLAVRADGSVLWKCPYSSAGAVGELVLGAGGTIYGTTDHLFAVSAAGVLKWSLSGFRGAMATAPNGTIYLRSGANLAAVAPSGVVKWQIPLQWETTAYTSEPAPVVAADGTIYVGSDSQNGLPSLVALNPDGTTKWVYTEGEPVRDPVVGTDGTIYICNGFSILAVSPLGKTVWSHAVAGVQSLKFGRDGRLYANSGVISAYSASGSKLWSTTSPSYVESQTPEIGADGSVYVADDFNSPDGPTYVQSGSRLSCLTSAGALTWAYYGGGPIAAASIGVDGTLYVPCSTGALRTVHADGSAGWSFTAASPLTDTPTLGADETSYFGSYDGTLYAVTSTGALKWKYKAKAPIWTAPAMSNDGSIYFISEDAIFYALDHSGKFKWSYQMLGSTHSSSPAVSPSGVLYASSYPGGGYAFTTEGSLLWQEKWGTDGVPTITAKGIIYFGGLGWNAVNSDGSLYFNYRNRTGGGTGAIALTQDDRMVTSHYFGAAGNMVGSGVWNWGFANVYDSINASLTSSTASDGTLYAYGGNFPILESYTGPPGQLFALSPLDGSVVWTLPFIQGNSFASSIGIDGTVYLVSDDGTIRAIG